MRTTVLLHGNSFWPINAIANATTVRPIHYDFNQCYRTSRLSDNNGIVGTPGCSATQMAAVEDEQRLREEVYQNQR